MKTSSLVLLVGGLVASAHAAEADNSVAPAINAVVKSVSTIITVVDGKSAKIARRDTKGCLEALTSMSKVATDAELTATMDASLGASLLSYAREHSSESGAIIAGCGTVTESGELSKAYASATSEYQQWFSSAVPIFQEVNKECKGVDAAEDVLPALWAVWSDCPQMQAAATGTDKLDNAASPRQTGAALVAVGVAGLVLAAL